MWRMYTVYHYHKGFFLLLIHISSLDSFAEFENLSEFLDNQKHAWCKVICIEYLERNICICMLSFIVIQNRVTTDLCEQYTGRGDTPGTLLCKTLHSKINRFL